LTEKLTAIIKIIRPLNFLITFASVIVAAVICLPGHSIEINVILAALSASLVMASGNIINDIYDIAIDKINKSLRPFHLVKYKLKMPTAYIFCLYFFRLSFRF